MRYFLICFFTFLCIGCSSVPKEYLSNDAICHYNDPIFKISDDELVLKPNIIEQLKNNEGSLIVIDNEEFKSRFYTLKSKQITNKQTNKQLGIGKWIRYRQNGTIRWVFNLYLNGDSKIVKETHYDEKGNITKVIDYEKGYNICWAEAIEIVKKIAKKEIEKYEITEFYAVHNNLNEFPDVQPFWSIGLLKGNEKYEDIKNRKGTRRYRIDGVTGKLLKKYRIKRAF